MTALFKFDLWLHRWTVSLIMPFALIFGLLFSNPASVTGLVIVLIMSLTMTQMDEKFHVRRFMHSLPLPRHVFLRARVFVVTTLGLSWVFFENVGRLFRDANFNLEFFAEVMTQTVMVCIIAALAVSIMTLMPPGILRYIITFVAYFLVTFPMIILSTFLSSFMLSDGFTMIGMVLQLLFIIIAASLYFLIIFAANKIRANQDVV